ncbi:MAG TPA: response regulator [Burkholderiales bacterium]|nr:response regulator [Burkholderiales bacterium]
MIAAAVERRDFDAIHKIGHNLLGSGEMFGFAELSRIGAGLQRAADAHDAAGVDRLRRRMAHYLAQTVAPISQQAHTVAAGTRRRATAVRAPRRHEVLVVDDDEMNRILITHYLEKAGYTVAQCARGEEALAALDAPRLPGLVLLDVVMPGRSGLDICRAIKADARTGSIPVVLLTALEKEEDRQRGMEAGADDFVTKPVSRVDLLARVAELLPRAGTRIPSAS